jgi:hypothetical protein
LANLGEAHLEVTDLAPTVRRLKLRFDELFRGRARGLETIEKRLCSGLNDP